MTVVTWLSLLRLASVLQPLLIFLGSTLRSDDDASVCVDTTAMKVPKVSIAGIAKAKLETELAATLLSICTMNSDTTGTPRAFSLGPLVDFQLHAKLAKLFNVTY